MNRCSSVSCCNSFFNSLQPKKIAAASAFVLGAAIGSSAGVAIATASVAYFVLRGPLYNFYQDWVDPEYSLSDRAETVMRGAPNGAALPQSLALVEALAIHGDPASRLQFGTVLMNGIAGTGRAFQNQKQGFAFYEFAQSRLEDGCLKAVACWNLAMCHYFGLGTDQNTAKAQEAFRTVSSIEILTSVTHPFAFQPKANLATQKETLLTLCRDEDRAVVEQSLQNFGT